MKQQRPVLVHLRSVKISPPGVAAHQLLLSQVLNIFVSRIPHLALRNLPRPDPAESLHHLQDRHAIFAPDHNGREVMDSDLHARDGRISGDVFGGACVFKRDTADLA